MRVNANQAVQRAQQLLSRGRFREAAAITRQLYRAKPDGAMIALLHGETALRAGRAGEALAALEVAARGGLADGPASAAWALLGECRSRMGDSAGGIDALNRALGMRNDDPLAARGLADALIDAGRLDEAQVVLSRFVNQDRLDPSIASIYARLCRRRKEPEEGVRALRRSISAGGASPGVHAALGQCLEAVGRFDEAFDAYEMANRSMGVRLDRKLHAKRTAAALAGLDGVRPAPGPGGLPGVLLIVGMPRSGTSLTEQIFASHPDVGACGESQSLPALWRRVCKDPARAFTPSVDDAVLLEEGRAYVEDLRAESSRAGVALLTDKNPMNLFLLSVAARALPGLRVIRCRRRAMDVCVSCYTSPLGPDHEYACDLQDCAAYFASAERVLDAAQNALGDAMLDVSYETLVRDPEPVIRGMLEHAGLAFDARCLSPERNERVVQTISRDQVTAAISDTSVGRWGRFGERVAPLREALSREGIGAGS
jgi:tetratricopeptide (TPR) repeat protein